MPQQIALLLASLFSINLLDVNIIFFCLDLSAKGRGDPMPFATIASVPQ